MGTVKRLSTQRAIKLWNEDRMIDKTVAPTKSCQWCKIWSRHSGGQSFGDCKLLPKWEQTPDLHYCHHFDFDQDRYMEQAYAEKTGS
jgi:hypothetical protein